MRFYFAKIIIFCVCIKRNGIFFVTLHPKKRTAMKQAMIFAAGLGTCLRPLTDTTPKALIEVGDKLTVIGVKATFNDAPQVSNGIYFSHEKAE